MNEEIEQVSKFYDVIIEFFASYSLQIIGALIIISLGFMASKYAHKYLIKLMLKNKLDHTLSIFVANLAKFLIIGMSAVMALGKLGVSIAPFVAALGALSLTAGLALQGSVANFAAGVILIITKPFKIGDTITVHNVYGAVSEIKLAYTVLINENKELITVPNKFMIGDILVNSYEYRLAEGEIGICAENNLEQIIEIITTTINSTDGISSQNSPIVGLAKFADSSVIIGYRYWAKTDSFFKIQYEINLKIINTLKANSISLPFPRQDILLLGGQK